MNIEEAFRLVENLDYCEGLKRKSAPGFSLIQIARFGEVVGVERYNSRPTEADQIELLNRFPGTIQINGRPGMYVSSDELLQHIKDSLWLFDRMNATTD